MRLHFKTLCIAVIVCAYSLLPAWVEAATYILTNLSGSASYYYGYVTSEGSQSESTGLAVSASSSGYFWQPWFITSSQALTVGLARSAASAGSENSSLSTAGQFSFDLFPQSRFPFSFSFERSDSRLDNTNNLNLSSTNSYTNTHLYMRQSYIGRRSLLADLSYIHNKSDSGYSDSSSDSLGASLRMRREAQIFTATSSYSTSQTSASTTEPKHYQVTLDHSYVPNTEFGVTTSASYNQNKVDSPGISTSAENSQASSFFSWRPEHRPYSFSGGARVSTAKTENAAIATSAGTSNSFSVNAGLGYLITTRLRFSGATTFSATEADSNQTLLSTQTGSLSYYSDPYLIAGFSYGWNGVSNLTNSNSQTDTDTVDRQSVSVGLGHRASRNWALGRTASMTTALSQNVSSTGSNQHGGSALTEGTDSSWGISHSASLGLNFRGMRGSTFLSLSGSDSRSYARQKDTIFQNVSMSLSRNYLINLLSQMQGSASMQVSRQGASDADTTTTKSAFATGNYSHSRAFGINLLLFTSSLSFQRSYDVLDVAQDSFDWDNRFSYHVGLLDTSLSIRVVKSSGISPTTTVNFRATRTF